MGSFKTKNEALAIVRAAIDEYGESYADDLLLGEEADDPDRTLHLVSPRYGRGPKKVAQGRQLAEMARVWGHRAGDHH